MVAAVAGVGTAVLLPVGLVWDERAIGGSAPALDVVFYLAMATGALALVVAPVAAAFGARRLATIGAAGPLAWVLTYGYWYLTVD